MCYFAFHAAFPTRHPRRWLVFSVITFVPRYLHGGTALLSSDQPHEAAPGWVRWFDAAISRYKEKNAFVCVQWWLMT